MTNSDDLTGRKAKLSDARRALLLKRLQGNKTGQETGSKIVPQPQEGLLPLSYTQQRVWFLQQLFADNRAYNMSEARRLRGSLDVDALRQALQDLVRRHASLRTSFVAPNDGPMQMVLPEIDLQVPLTDLSHLSPAAREELIPRMVLAEGYHAFDLERAPLFRPSIIRLDDEDHVLQLVMHHIITDEWSNDIIWRELNICFGKIKGTQAADLAKIAINYTDYARWQREQTASGALDQQMRYWQDQLSGDLPILQLQVDRPRPARQTLRGGILRRTFPASLLQELQSLSQEAGTTLYTTLLAAFHALLYRYSRQEDILVGTPIANRQQPETQHVIGMFINTAVMRAKLSSELSFRQHLSQVRQTVFDALANQDLPFDLLVQAMHPDRDLSYNPLFQTMFVFRADSAERTLPGLTSEPVRVDPGVSKFDLTLFAGEAEGRLFSALEYSSDLFDVSTAERMLEQWQILLSALTANPDAPIAALPLLSAYERDSVIRTWNKTTTPLPELRCLHELISEQAAKNPQATAVISENERFTYTELEALANQLAHRLVKNGIRPGTPVGLFVERSPQMLVGILGIMKAGGAYVPLAPNYPPERIAFALADTQTPLVVTQSQLLPKLPPTAAVVLALDADLTVDAEWPAEPPDTAVTLDDLAYIIYTSGSTGTPKGVMVSHRNLLASTFARKAYYKEPVGRFLLLSSFAFDSSVAGIFWTLASGGALVLPAPDDEKDVQKLAATIAHEQVTHTLALPSLYRLLLTYAPDRSLDSLQVVIAAGEACPPDLGEMHYGHLPKSALFNEYGPTEATVWCSVYRLPRISDDKPVPIGRPIANSQLFILDQLQQPVPIGVPGELFVGGAGVTPGYWNNPDLTAERFPTVDWEGYPEIGRVYRTGDLARWLDNGQIEFLGRVDNQVKIRGFRIEPGEIETRLITHPALRDAAVIVAEHDNGSAASKSLVAYVVAEQSPAAEDSSSLRNYLSERLPEYMVPAQILFLPALPRTPNGKLDHKRLPAPELDRERPFVPARTQNEKILARIWCEVLNVNEVSIEDKFFALGGDSIMSIQVIARARQEGLVLTPRQMFEEQTIARLAAAAVAVLEGEAAPAVAAGPVSLTPIQHWFFAQNLIDPAHWNQAAWFEATTTVNRDYLDAAITQLVEHHAMLRAHYTMRGNNWQQEIRDEVDPFTVNLVSLADLDPSAQDAAMVATANSLHLQLDLANGPLLQGALFDLGSDRLPRLLLVIHHLVVDAVSWRIVSADLVTAYRQIAAGKVISLPAASATYPQWAHTLSNLAGSDDWQQEKEFWLRETKRSAPFPRDFANGGSNSEGRSALVSVSLDSEQTALLLRDVHQAYHTRIDDLLLTALGRAVTKWTGDNSLLLTLERHGREEIDPRLDTSQTIGWFTSLFPLSLTLANNEDVGANIRYVKEQLRRVPRNGISFGILRYLGDEAIQQQLAELPQPEILFNYLGQINRDAAAGTILQPLPANTGQAYGPQNERVHLLDINARVANGRLTVNWQYPSAYFQAATIEALAESTLVELNRVIEHCLNLEQSQYTPSDFPLAGLEQGGLDSLSDLLAGLE